MLNEKKKQFGIWDKNNTDSTYRSDLLEERFYSHLLYWLFSSPIAATSVFPGVEKNCLFHSENHIFQEILLFYIWIKKCIEENWLALLLYKKIF